MQGHQEAASHLLNLLPLSGFIFKQVLHMVAEWLPTHLGLHLSLVMSQLIHRKDLFSMIPSVLLQGEGLPAWLQ